MKNILILLVSIFSVSCYSQTQIPGSRIKPGTVGTEQLAPSAVTPEKLSSDALRPTVAILPGPELTFDQVNKVYTLTMSADINMLLAGSGNVAHSRITLIVTGDGSHVMTFPSNWVMRGDAFSPGSTQEINLRYNGQTVIGEIIRISTIDAVATQLTSAVVTNTPPTELNLVFNEAVGIAVEGWSVSATGGAVVLDSVRGSGTTTPVFYMSRAIESDETVTISYNPGTGNTLDLLGFELAAVTSFSVTPPEDLPDPEIPQFDVIVGSGGYSTIQAGSDAAVSGDIVGIKGGTYRETIVGKSGVTYRPFPGETVIISGLELVGNSGWTVHSGQIYKKTITLPVSNLYNNLDTNNDDNFNNDVLTNTTLFANQVFKDGVMMFEARYPNLTDLNDLFDISKRRNISSTTTFSNTQITDTGLGALDTGPLSSDGLTGGKVIIQGWFYTQTGNINSHSGNSIGISGQTGNNLSSDARFRTNYHVTGKLSLLDAEKEWHYESGTLYFRQSGGGTPTGLEYKARNWGFDLTGKSNVTIEGITFIGCDPVHSNSATNDNTVLDNIRASYMNHQVADLSFSHPGFGNARRTGSRLLGANCVVKNSEFQYSGSTVFWAGTNCRIENNYFHHIGYEGNWGAPVNMWDKAGGQKVLWNTMHDLGRGGVDFGWVNHNQTTGETGQHLNVEIGYNHLYRFGMTNWDGGVIYAHGKANLTGMEIHHNWIHHQLGPDLPNQGGQYGIYFDQSSGGGSVHHNVTWETASADFYHETMNEHNNPVSGRKTNIYNNTFAGTNMTNSANSSYRSYRTDANWFDVQRNNIYRRNMVVGWPSQPIKGNTSFSLPVTTSPSFVGGDPATIGGHAFLLNSGSPAIDAGTPSFTGYDGVTITVPYLGSAPDMGAYERTDPDPWVPGYNEVQGVADGVINDNQFTFSTGWNYAPNFKTNFHNGDATYTVTLNSTATYEFTGSEVELFMEKCNNSAVARITIRNSSNSTVETEDVNLYVVDPGGATTVCPNGSLESVFTSAAFSGGTCTDCTIEIKLQTQNTGVTPQRTALVLDKLVITP